MRRLLLLSAAFSAAPALAQPAVIPPPSVSAQGDVAVTIYNNDLALVQDVRNLDLASGRVRQEFPDVSAQIQPQTVTMTGDGLDIIEQNFDFDLLSPSALMQKAVGETITIIRTNPATGAETREQARVLAVNGGVVLQIGQRIEVLRDDGLPVRVVFDRVPENLRARPTLSVTFNSHRGGRRPVNLTYLTRGLGWAADYVALFDQAQGRMDVQGWITLTNNSGTEYRNANTLLVAGAVGEQQASNGYYPRPTPAPRIRQAGTESSDRERIGDFYIYPIAGRTTIANRQTKQVSFLNVAGTPAQRAYEYRNGWLGTADQPQNVNTVLRFSTSRDQGLGDALPAGTVRVYQRDARGNPQFVGESRIDHTPMGSDIGLTTGQAFDVKVQPVVEARDHITVDQWRQSYRFRINNPDGTQTTGEADVNDRTTFYQTRMRYTVTNARPEPVTVSIYQSGLGGYYADTRLIAQTVGGQAVQGERLSEDQMVWRVPVPANGTATLNVTYQTRY
jgi:hypothetical protein